MIIVEASVIKFGAIFEDKDIVQRIAFTNAVESLNAKSNLVLAPVTFVPIIYTVPIADSYKVLQKGTTYCFTHPTSDNVM